MDILQIPKNEADRPRRKNFTEFEKNNLGAIVSKYRNIVENKCTKAAIVQKKVKIWELITEEFNLSAETCPRTVKQLKTLYDNMKRESRRTTDDKGQVDPLESEYDGSAADELDIKDFKIPAESAELLPSVAISDPVPTTIEPVLEPSSSVTSISVPIPTPSSHVNIISTRRRNKIIPVECLKRQYYIQKLKNAKFEARTLKIIRALTIKKLQLEIEALIK